MVTRIIALSCLLLVVFAIPASCGIPTVNFCYDPMIRTVRLHKTGEELSPPILQLNGPERLTLSFDDLGPDLRRFKFTIQHCSFNWNPSEDISSNDFIEGWKEENIETYEYSYNTTVKYIHYRAMVPSENLKPKVSGNYLLIVYDEDPARVVFTRRFMVVESSPLAISGRVVQSTRMEEYLTRQQIDFEVKLNGFEINDVTREIRTVVQQNGRYDNMLVILKPRITRPGELDYRYDENISMPGGNQFRNFDTKSLVYQSERIGKIVYDTMFQVYLLRDDPRTYKQYTFDEDLNGRYFVKNEEHAENSAIEADYTMVHFFLPYPSQLMNGNFYILGDLTQWQLDNGSRMFYNPVRRGYEADLFLKQGYYNYMYAYQDKGNPVGDVTLIEGSHWETENDYTIYVYFRATGALFDRLISISTMNSKQL